MKQFEGQSGGWKRRNPDMKGTFKPCWTTPQNSLNAPRLQSRNYKVWGDLPKRSGSAPLKFTEAMQAICPTGSIWFSLNWSIFREQTRIEPLFLSHFCGCWLQKRLFWKTSVWKAEKKQWWRQNGFKHQAQIRLRSPRKWFCIIKEITLRTAESPVGAISGSEMVLEMG